EQLSYAAEKALKDGGEKVPAEVRTDVEAKINDVKKLKDSDNKQAIENASKALSDAMQKIGQAAYQGAAGAQNGPQAGPAAGANDKGPVEGEVVDDKK
ncbi:molecular chaperone DnaK, partial [Patescibacteria group bacterium]